CVFDDDGNLTPGCGQSYAQGLTDPKDGLGLRFLTRVHTGMGAELRFRYDPIAATDEGRVPHPVWVVTSTTTNPGVQADGTASADAVTTYQYRGPVYDKDLDGKWGFRGFGMVTRVDPVGATAVTLSSYDLSYAGLVVDQRVYQATGPGFSTFGQLGPVAS